MNKDFHYEGTYVAARIAGFDKPGEAQIIAWAAQTVDECVQGKVKERGIQNFIYTCESLIQNVKDLTKDLQNINGDDRQKIRKIWMPFHFLPGNLNHQNTTLANEDIQDFACICKPNSELLVKLVNDLKNEYKPLQDGQLYDPKNIQFLFNIGVLMHVLADTWAHQNFAGTPNYNINYCQNVEVDKASKPADCDDKILSQENFNKNSIIYLGHGCAGHYPDYGCLKFRYKPLWSQMSTCRDNQLIFQCAFAQMVQAMRCIRNNKAFVARAEIDLLKDFMALNSTKESDQPLDYYTSIKKVIAYPCADQSKKWRDEIIDNNFGLTYLEEYTLNHDNDDMLYFQNAAKEHRRKVVDYLLQHSINI